MLWQLDAPAWERLRIFMRSPWFNRSPAVRGLLEGLFEVWGRQRPLPADTALYAMAVGDAPFDPTRLKNLKAALQRKLDDFLAQSAFEADTLLQDRLLLQQLNLLSESQQFQRYHMRAVERIEAAAIEEDQRQLLLFHSAEAWDLAQLRLGSRAQGQHLDASFQHAWQFFQIQVVKFLVRQANRGAIEGEAADTASAQRLLAIIDEVPAKAPVLRLYRRLLDVFREPAQQAHFAALRDELREEGQALAAPDARDIYTGAINHCIRRINAGEVALAEPMLGLYQEMDSRDLLLVNDRLPAAQFKNMVGLALRFKAFEWAQLVIDRHGGRIDQDAYGNAAAFNQGMLHFSQGQFAAAERCFHQVLQRFEDIFYGLDARIYLLRIYYETGDWTGMESMAESFRMLLKRNKHIPKAHRQSYLHSAKFFAKLAKVPEWNDKALARLRAEVAQTAFAGASKQWLLEKLDQRLG